MAAAMEGVSYTLPDGNAIALPPAALACVGEAVFDPRGMTGQPAAGLTEEVLQAVKTCLPDYRRQMCAACWCGPLRRPADASTLRTQDGERAAVRRRAAAGRPRGAAAE